MRVRDGLAGTARSSTEHAASRCLDGRLASEKPGRPGFLAPRSCAAEPAGSARRGGGCRAGWADPYRWKRADGRATVVPIRDFPKVELVLTYPRLIGRDGCDGALSSWGLAVAVAWPLVARAQQRWHIGLPSAGSSNALTDVIISTLQELGYFDGRNIVIERRFAEGHLDRLTDFATELVNLHVDVIVTLSTPAGIAAKKATSSIPIVLAANSDPVGVGLVASLARPGGNATGDVADGARSQRETPRNTFCHRAINITRRHIVGFLKSRNGPARA